MASRELPYVAKVWLALAKGDDWEPQGLHRAMNEQSKTLENTRQALTYLEREGMVRRVRHGLYRITHTCRVPGGLTVREVYEAFASARAPDPASYIQP